MRRTTISVARFLGPVTAFVAAGPVATAQPKERATVKAHPTYVIAVSYSKDGKTLYSKDGKTLAMACRDKTMLLSDAAVGKPKITLRGHDQIVQTAVLSQAGKTVASGGWDGIVRLWDAATVR